MNFCEKISRGVNKPITKFIKDKEYGIVSSGSCLISNISRCLNENIELKNTIERLCDNLNYFNDTDKIYKNYIETIGDVYGDEPGLYLTILIYLKYMEGNLKIWMM